MLLFYVLCLFFNEYFVIRIKIIATILTLIVFP